MMTENAYDRALFLIDKNRMDEMRKTWILKDNSDFNNYGGCVYVKYRL